MGTITDLCTEWNRMVTPDPELTQRVQEALDNKQIALIGPDCIYPTHPSS